MQFLDVLHEWRKNDNLPFRAKRFSYYDLFCKVSIVPHLTSIYDDIVKISYSELPATENNIKTSALRHVFGANISPKGTETSLYCYDEI